MPKPTGSSEEAEADSTSDASGEARSAPEADAGSAPERSAQETETSPETTDEARAEPESPAPSETTGGTRASTEAERNPLERAADEAVEILSRMPPLALMAVIAALFELSFGRLAWHGLTDVVDGIELLEVRRWARFPQNLAAVSGTFALTLALLGYLRLPGYAPIGRRLAVAAFSGIFVPSVVVATFLPYAALRPKLVIFGLAAANVLVTLLGMTAVRHRPGGALRMAVAAVTVACFATLLVVGLGQLVTVPPEGIWAPVSALFTNNPTTTQNVLLSIRHLGELAWLAAVVGAAWAAVTTAGESGLRVRASAGLGLFAVVAIGIVLAEQGIGHRFRLVLFGSFRLGLLSDHAPLAYAFPLAAGVAGGFVGLARRDPAIRQLAAGLLAWLAAGFAPHTPIQLLYLVLGATLMTRAAQALDPRGAWRERQPWAQLTGAPPPREPKHLGPKVDDRVEHETYDEL